MTPLISSPRALHDSFADLITHEARETVFNGLFLNFHKGWKMPFFLMLRLSVSIAKLVTSEESAANVICAMIVVPLGRPLIALGASIPLGWVGPAGRVFALILLGAVIVLSTVFVPGVFLPDDTPSRQILARTAPDIRDLAIVLFAGAAGALSFYRNENPAVLPGVAIAVALVPPLGVAGLMVEEGRYILAFGGFTLFAANLVGVFLATIMTFFVLGGHARG